MNIERVLDHVMASAANDPKLLLFLLVKRLGEYPDAFQAIPDAIRDLAQMDSDQADALERDATREAEIMPFPAGDGAA